MSPFLCKGGKGMSESISMIVGTIGILTAIGIGVYTLVKKRRKDM